MKIRNLRSIIIILVYLFMNLVILMAAYMQNEDEAQILSSTASAAKESTEIENLNYFHSKAGVPQLSLTALKMKSQGEEVAEFDAPKGVYNYQKRNQTLRYEADQGTYKKIKQSLVLTGNAKVLSDEAEYNAKTIKYFLKKDLVLGLGGVNFKGEDLKSKDRVEITAQTMRANPQNQFSHFKGEVQGSLQRKKKYEGKMTFSSQQLQLDGIKSLAHLEGDVRMTRQSYLITAGKADIYLENFNKSLKYFVFNDDVKVTETLRTPDGKVTQRKSFSERLEGFGKDQKMVLSGAPKVEHGEDVVKGYRITIRENMDLIEVDDAMSDVQVKRENEKSKKN